MRNINVSHPCNICNYQQIKEMDFMFYLHARLYTPAYSGSLLLSN